MIPLDIINYSSLPVNLFYHPNPNAIGKPGLVGRPGYTIKDSEGSKIRGGCQLAATGYVWVDDDLYSFNGSSLSLAKASFTNSASSTYDKLVQGDDHVVAIENDEYIHWYKASTGTNGSVDISAIGGPAYLRALTYQDGFFITSGQYQNQFFISERYDPSTWNAADVEDSEYKFDYALSLESLKRSLYVFGLYSYEIYSNEGLSDFPFVRVGGGVFDTGIYAERTLVNCNEALYFLAQNRTVMMIEGYSSYEISDPVVNSILADMTSPGDAFGWSWFIDGMWFYCLSFIVEDICLAYNTSTGKWFKMMEGATGASRFPASCAFVFNKQSYVGLNDDVVLLEIDRFNDGSTSNPIHKEFQTVVMDAERAKMFFGKLELWCKENVGTTTVSPEIDVSWSDDMGTTFSDVRTLTLGESDGDNKFLETYGMGASEQRIYKFVASNIYELVIYGGYVE